MKVKRQKRSALVIISFERATVVVVSAVEVHTRDSREKTNEITEEIDAPDSQRHPGPAPEDSGYKPLQSLYS
ncbi:hypothetical protein C8R46DRAFT_1060778 [Mycena filopes]|nr:hypothetical protein C8R46DRAFT_1060778 [Mycena filopes]